MMRVGSVGAGQVDDLPLGSTAATLANTRILPGGVIRPHRQIPPANPGWPVDGLGWVDSQPSCCAPPAAMPTRCLG